MVHIVISAANNSDDKGTWWDRVGINSHSSFIHRCHGLTLLVRLMMELHFWGRGQLCPLSLGLWLMFRGRW